VPEAVPDNRYNGGMLKQTTILQSVRATGVGLHSGAKVTMVLRPAAPDTGIVFHRVDLTPPVSLQADPYGVGDTRMASCLEKDGAKVGTVEHLMSALAGLGIDNVHVDVDAAEIPIMDGSAAPFVFLLQSAGIEEQNAPKKFIRVRKAVEVRDGDKWARLEPYDGFRLSFSIVFNHPAVDQTGNFVTVDFADNSYVREVARARTFGFTQDVEAMRNAGLGRGGSLDNAVVIAMACLTLPPKQRLWGMILGAGYMLYLYRRVVFGRITRDDLRSILDLNAREWAIFAPLIVLTMWMGIYPSSFSSFWETSVAALVKHHQAAMETATKLAGVMH